LIYFSTSVIDQNSKKDRGGSCPPTECNGSLP
jgi:hypothetical protein